MPADEFEAWREFYTLFPFDDLHRFHRPAALVASAMVSGDQTQAFRERVKFLQPDPPPPEVLSGRYSEADLRTMRAFGVIKD